MCVKEVVEVTPEEKTCLTKARALIGQIYSECDAYGSLDKLLNRMTDDFDELLDFYVVDE